MLLDANTHVLPEFLQKTLFERLDKFFHIGGGFQHGLGRDRGHAQALGLLLGLGVSGVGFSASMLSRAVSTALALSSR